MSKTGNKRISTFINKVLPKHINDTPIGVWKTFTYKYCYYDNGKWIPLYQYLRIGYFTKSEYRNQRTKRLETMYYITPLGQEEIVKELKDISPVAFGYGLSEDISHIL